MFLKSKKDLVGVDVGSSAVKLVQLREVKGVFHLVNLGSAPLPAEAIVDNSIMDSSAVVDAIRELFSGLKIKTKNVSTSISGHAVIIRKITMPMMTEEELESSIQWEAEQYIPFEVDEVFLDFQILGASDDDPSQMKVMLVAAKKDFVNDYLAVFREAGLNPIVVDVDCFAVENMCEVNYGFDEDEITALLNVGASAMNINVLKGGESVFTRDVQVGGNLFNEELQKRLGLSGQAAEKVKMGEDAQGVDAAVVGEILKDASESMAQEAQRSLDFFSATSSDETMGKVLLTGGVSSVPTVVQSLRDRLGIPVEVVDAFRNIVVNEKDFDLEYVKSMGPSLSVAVGLAMRRVGDK